VARAVSVILDDPAPHIGHVYNLTGFESADLDWRSGRDRHRSPQCHGSRVAARHRQARIAAAGSRDWSGPVPE
jgi:hypothetical protein